MVANQNSIRGLQGNGYNCSLIAMDNAGLIPDATYLTPYGMRVSDIERTLHLQAHTIEVVNFRFGRCRIKQFAKEHPEGIFITSSRNHCAAVVDGVIYNSKRNQLIKWAWKISKREPKMMGSY